MIIGLSLPLEYLIGVKASAEMSHFAEAFGKPSDCLPELEDHGVSSIELRGIAPHTTADSLLRAAQSILSAGLHLTLHGTLSGHAASNLFDGAHPQLLPVVNYLRNQQEKTVIVVHTLADPQARYDSMTNSTERALEQLAKSIHAHSLPVRIALEISRYHGVHSPGTTYEGLLEVVQDLHSTEIGFCWDMGHTHSSLLQNRLAATPPPAFIKRTIHTHLHGLSQDGDTHRPLIRSSAHIASGIGQLQSAGYSGTYNLELYPARWGTEPTVRDGILGSILCLQNILNVAPVE